MVSACFIPKTNRMMKRHSILSRLGFPWVLLSCILASPLWAQDVLTLQVDAPLPANSGTFLSVVTTNSAVLSGSNTVAGAARVVVNGDDATFAGGVWTKTQPLTPGVNHLSVAALDPSGAVLASTNYLIVSETATTNVSGTLGASTVWNSAMGIVHMTGDVTVPAGGTLTIKPGTVVLAAEGASLRTSDGTISALGTADEPVYFLPEDGSSVWGEIAASGTDGALLLQHVETIAGHIELLDGSMGTLEDSYFHDYTTSSPAIIHTLGNPNRVTLNLRRCHVARYYEVLSQLSTNHIEDCLLEWQAPGGDGIDFDAGQAGSYIRRCTLRYGRFSNIDALDMGEVFGTSEYTEGVLIDSCLLHDFADKGVSMGIQVDVTVTNTLIYNVDSGIAVKDRSTAGIYNTTIANANVGFKGYNKADSGASSGGGYITNSFNNLLWNCTNDAVSLRNGSTLEATDSDFQGTNFPGTGNISSDPMFVDAAAHDYHVAAGSPTLGSGLGGGNIGVTFPVGGLPGAPFDLAVVGGGANPIALSWKDDADNESGFDVERSIDGVNWTTLDGVGPNVTDYTDTGAAAGRKYYYRVKATNTSGDSLYSNPAGGMRQSAQISVAGTISSDTTWTSGNQYIVTSSVTVASGATLTIEPGATVLFNDGQNLTVADGGRVLAEGTPDQRILFTRNSGASAWGNITINGSAGSPETGIAYADFEFNANSSSRPCLQVSAGTVYFDHLVFKNTAAPYIHVDSASFIIANSMFPSATAQFELCHGTGGIKSGGHGIFRGNYMGSPIGYNDSFDFTGGNRPGPIVQFIDNVFNGATDDCLDLDGTDAWVDGNIFLHVHKNGSPDTASGVSGGDDGSRTSEITIIRNIFYDCDQAAMAKQGDFYTFINNTVVRQTHQGGTDNEGAVVAVEDGGVAEARGMYLEGNVVHDAEELVRNLTSAIVTWTNNILPLAWTGQGGGNSVTDPMLMHIPALSETLFTNWTDAQVMRDWFGLQPGSPAIGTGPNGQDKGAIIPFGASISGEPGPSDSPSSVTLNVGINRTGYGIPASGWPNGSGYTDYKWRLDGGPWSGETPIDTPITLTGLGAGPHYVEVVGKLDSGFYQDDPAFGGEATITRSGVWGFQIASAEVSGTMFMLHFTAVAGQAYTVEYRDAFDDMHPWTTLMDVPAQATTGDYTVTDTIAPGTSRFYRVVIPGGQ